jgi:hypothetical protein
MELVDLAVVVRVEILASLELLTLVVAVVVLIIKVQIHQVVMAVQE